MGLIQSVSLSLPFKDPVIVFSIVLFIILMAPILLSRLRIPSVIVLILAGLAVGPHGFHILEKDSAIDLFGTVGLLYIMFMAGLELDLNEFNKNKYKSIVFGLLTFSIPLAMGYWGCQYILNFDAKGSLLVASMFATHTLVAYPVISRLGLTRNEAVTITVGGTIITDTLVLLILAVITGSSQGEMNQDFWIKLGGSLILFSLIIFLILPKIARWFLKNIEGEKTSQYIFILSMVFLSAFLAEVAGIEAIIGAFMAGLALNRLIPHTSALMNRIEFVGNALFIPFFLIRVGMLIDLRVLFKGNEALIVAGVLTGIALITKFFAAKITQWIFKLNNLQGNLIFGLSSSHAAATIAVILIGYDLKIVNENVLNGTILLILVTCLVGSFVAENTGRKLVTLLNEKLPSLPENDERIMVAVSNPETIENMLDLALILKDKGSNNPVYPLSVVKDDTEAKEKVLLSNRMLEKAEKHASSAEMPVQVVTRVDLNAASGIVRAVKELMISEVILGWHEKETFSNRIFGNTLNNVLSRTSEMLIVQHLQQPINTFKKIILVVPQNAEFEKGFQLWVGKIKKLNAELSSELVIYCDEKSVLKIKEQINSGKQKVNAKFEILNDFEDFLIVSKDIKRDTLLILVSARKGSISYGFAHEKINTVLSKYFVENSFMIIYPEVNQGVLLEGNIQSSDTEANAIQENIERINKLGKQVKKIFGTGKGE